MFGSATFGRPRVGVGNLAATDGEDTKYLLLGGSMLIGAIAVLLRPAVSRAGVR